MLSVCLPPAVPSGFENVPTDNGPALGAYINSLPADQQQQVG